MYKKTYVLTAAILFLLLLGHSWTVAQSEPPSISLQSALFLPGQSIDMSWFNNAAQSSPAVAYDNYLNEFLVVWHSDGGTGDYRIFATQISAAGEIKSQFVLANTHDRIQPSVAYDSVNHRYLVVWSEDVSGSGTDWDIYGAFVTPTLFAPQIGTPFAINEFSTNQLDSRVAYASSAKEFFVVWNNFVGGGVPDYISGRRIKADGTFPSAGVDLTLSHVSHYRLTPDIVYNGNLEQYLIVWEEFSPERDIYGQIIGTTGSLVGSPFGIAAWPGAEAHPSVAFCERTGQYLVAWQAEAAGGQYDIYARLVSGAGVPGTAGLIYGLSVNETRPSAACSPAGQSYLVTWAQQYSSTFGLFGVWGREVGSNLSLEPLFVLAAPHQGLTYGHLNPFVAAGGTGYLVVWEHEIGTNMQSIYGRFLANEAVFIPLVIK